MAHGCASGLLLAPAPHQKYGAARLVLSQSLFDQFVLLLHILRFTLECPPLWLMSSERTVVLLCDLCGLIVPILGMYALLMARKHWTSMQVTFLTGPQSSCCAR